MRYCWTLVMVAGLLGMNAVGWMAYQSKPKAAPRIVVPPPKPPDPEEKEKPKPPDPEPKEKPKPAEPPVGYLKSMEDGEQAIKERRWHHAVLCFSAAAEAWEPGRAKAEVRMKEARNSAAREFEGLMTQARELVKNKALAAARIKVNEALTLDADSADARALLLEIDRLLTPPPGKKLEGDLLVLVLRTPTSSLANTDFRAGLKGLEDAPGKKGTLLGGKVWVLDSRGPQMWDPAAEYPASAALDNRDFDQLVKAIRAATGRLDDRAVRPKFRVVVVWETDNKIAGPIALPDRRYHLAYRYTLGDEDIKGLDESFVFASRFRSPGAVQKEVTFVATRKAPGGAP